MAMSGVPVSDECMKAFDELKAKKSLRFITFVVEKNQIIVQNKNVLDQNQPGKWSDFVEEFKDDECKWGYYDMPIITKDNAATNKIIMCQWTGPSASIKKKMVMSSSQSALKEKAKPDAFAQLDDRAEFMDAQKVLEMTSLDKAKVDRSRFEDLE